MKKGIIILGSSNSKGETYKLANYISQKAGYEIIDLKTKSIAEFDYEFKNNKDNFLPIMEKIVTNYEIIIFATPVYWYSMSGMLKTFFDRISDCLETRKDLGKKLKGMEMAVISSGSDKELKNGFHMPFVETAKYLGMKYITDVHGWIENGNISNEVKLKLTSFIKQIQ